MQENTQANVQELSLAEVEMVAGGGGIDRGPLEITINNLLSDAGRAQLARRHAGNISSKFTIVLSNHFRSHTCNRIRKPKPKCKNCRWLNCSKSPVVSIAIIPRLTSASERVTVWRLPASRDRTATLRAVRLFFWLGGRQFQKNLTVAARRCQIFYWANGMPPCLHRLNAPDKAAFK